MVGGTPCIARSPLICGRSYKLNQREYYKVRTMHRWAHPAASSSATIRLFPRSSLSGRCCAKVPRYLVSRYDSRQIRLDSATCIVASHNFTRTSRLGRRGAEAPERSRRSVVVRAEADNGREHPDDEVIAPLPQILRRG